MQDREARAKLVEYLKSINAFGVIHYGHFGNYFHVLSHSNSITLQKGEIYSAMFEEFDDKFGFRTELSMLKLEEKDSWSSILLKLSVT